jgi:ATP-dependent Lon protease
MLKLRNLPNKKMKKKEISNQKEVKRMEETDKSSAKNHKKRPPPPPNNDERSKKNEALWDRMFEKIAQENRLDEDSDSDSDSQNEPVKPLKAMKSGKAAQRKTKRFLPKRNSKKKPKVEIIAEEEKESSESDSDSDFDSNDANEASMSQSDEEKTVVGLNGLGPFLMSALRTGGFEDIEDVWQNDLTEAEIAKYEWIFKGLEEMQLDIPKILRSNLSDKEKENAIGVMLNFQVNSPQYEEVARLIRKRKETPVSVEKLERYEKLEQELLRQTTDRVSVKFQILDLPIAAQYRRNVWDVYDQIQQLEPGTSDYHKHFEWLQWIIRMPWGKTFPMPVFLDSSQLRHALTSLRVDLDKKVYGMPHIKEEITLFSMDRFIPTTGFGKSGRILCIEGSPGVGKTHLIRTLAKSWNLPFVGIAAGGCKDASFWEGHGRTYEGAIPGRIVHAIKQMNAMNGVIYIDEIDKLSDQSQDVSSALMHLLDESQNSEWYDKYFGDIPLDLSKILWVLSINDRNAIHPVLRDRLHIIKVPDPSLKDKVETAKLVLIPDLMAVHGLNSDDVEWPDEVITHIIKEKTEKEKGLRTLKQCIEAIIQRLAYLKHTLIGLPSSAIWHAAAVGAQQGVSFNQIKSTAEGSTKDDRERFINQTTFFFPDFRMPMTLTVAIVGKLLEHFLPSEAFDYQKSGWIM